jgi:hypothetical protein
MVVFKFLDAMLTLTIATENQRHAAEIGCIISSGPVVPPHITCGWRVMRMTPVSHRCSFGSSTAATWRGP